MPDDLSTLLREFDRRPITRRRLLQLIGLTAAGVPMASALAQGRCIRSLGTPACDTMPITPLFKPTGWKTVLLDSITMQVTDYQKEAAFYAALMGWTLRSDDGKQAVMDIGTVGSMVFKGPSDSAGPGGGRAGNRAVVESFCFGIEPWDAKKVDAELRARGLAPVADNRANGYESFHVKDPDGFDLQISNGTAKNRRTTPANAKLLSPPPFESTGWKTIWLDHLSFSVTNYKESASFYTNLLGWKSTYDEGSQNECLIGEVGDIIIRGGNPLAPNFGRGGRGGARGGSGGGGDSASGRATQAAPAPRQARVDHISFGIAPWDTDKVKADLESRGLRAQIDTSTGDEIHVAAFKSYHTSTPNGYNLQISYVTHDTRLTLPNAVRPKPPGGR
jgi:catechol 2,3-dioxygenase-like lactoylglutathione lyase family enzyme